MIVFEGRAALSAFRLSRLARRLGLADEGLQATFVYFLDMPAADAAQAAQLARILEARQVVLADLGSGLYVVPRLGTVSPWASKATDILRACGLPVARVERGVAYRFAAAPALDAATLR
ncbi:MAG: hypothetical protein WCZ65_11480, partial [Lysobacteraceae bacterium]